MNKKVKIILLSTVMTTPTIIPLLAASCANEDPESEIKQIKVSVTTLDKFAKDVTDSDIKITGYRPSVFKISQRTNQTVAIQLR
ncbi:variable surface lipoprotein [Metamycoplasma hyosynoviae]|uniref:variable surface lipoprotein n=1 Tax=Metamycoplasma hyosynoviae TaxID=29559 RepID=UPI002361DC46|nr:variable surface lipoprotein [Metamycoplasma hyosynoviae]MDD1360217.1 variable surface lipoprotein [Metamycoplasma hyosynoviae]